MRGILRYVKRLKPRAFVMENVVGLRSIHNGSLFKELLSNFERSGYLCETFVLDAADDGVPQNRKRLFIIGTAKTKAPLGLPPPTHTSETIRTVLDHNLRPHRTVEDAVWDLPGSAFTFYAESKTPIAFLTIQTRLANIRAS